jgi:hypothetical protein
MAMDISKLNCDELFTVVSKEIGECPADILQKNGVTGRGLLEISDEEAKEIFPVLGDRLSIRAFVRISKGTSQAHQTTQKACSLKSYPKIQGWAQELIIPEPSVFSTPTMKFLLGEEQEVFLFTKAVRIEIVGILTNAIMMHTRFPKSEEYNMVCLKLIERYPKLQDTIGNGYVS